MGILDSIFGDKKTTTSTSSQTGDQSYGLTPEVMKYWQSISGMYGPNAWTNVDPNQYQQQAAQAGAGYASGLNPAVAGAMGIGASGLDPNSIARYQSPYTQQVIDATQRDFDTQNARQNASVNANAAKLGALSGTQPLVARNLASESQRRQQDPIIANLRNQGFNTAAGLAGQDVNARLAGLGAAGSLIGQQAGITNQSFGQGSQLWNQAWQNALMPYQLAQQGASTLGGLTGASGQHTSGTATGTQTQTGTPSPFSIGMNLAGLGMSLFSDARLKENIKTVGETYDGQPIYKYNFKGSPKTEIGFLAQDVEQRQPEAVGSISGLKTVDYDMATKDAERPRKASGGGVGGDDRHERLASAFEAVHGLLHKARGGSVMKPRFAGGGDVGLTGWEAGTTVNPAGSSFDFKKLGSGLSSLGQKSQGSQGGDDGGMLRSQQEGLSRMLSGMGGARPGFASGGFAGEWGENGPLFDDRPGEASGLGAPMFAGVGSGVSRSELPPTREPISPSISPPVSRDDLIGAIKGFEGFNPKAYGDYKQHSIGYGTRATRPDETITREEADRRLADEVAAAERHVDAFAPNLDPGTRAALTSLTYNAGTDWQKAGLGAAIKAGNMDEAKKLFVQYNKAGGNELPGLTNRRNAEVGWIGAGSRVPNPITDPPDAYYPTDYKGPATRDVPGDWRARGSGTSVPTSSRGTIADAPSEKSWLQRILPGLNEGIFVGKEMTPGQRLGAMLMAVRSPTVNALGNGVSDNIMAQNQARMEERRIDNQVAQMLGQLNGRPTIEAQRLALEEAKNPAMIRHLDATAKKAELDADKDYQLEYLRRKAEADKAVVRADLEERWKLFDRLNTQAPQSQTPWAKPGARLRAVEVKPQPPPQAPAQSQPVLPSAPPPTQVSPPMAPEYAPPEDSPAGRAASRRIEAGRRMQEAAQQRQSEQRQMQAQFDTDVSKLSPYAFVQKYGNNRQNLSAAQIAKLDQMIDMLMRSQPNAN